jgi:hypothetical protein
LPPHEAPLEGLLEAEKGDQPAAEAK